MPLRLGPRLADLRGRVCRDCQLALPGKVLPERAAEHLDLVGGAVLALLPFLVVPEHRHRRRLAVVRPALIEQLPLRGEDHLELGREQRRLLLL